MMPVNEHSIFRHRGYICAECGLTTMVFGGDPAPVTGCTRCGVENNLTLKWDHMVTQTVVVEPYVEPAAVEPKVEPVPVQSS